MIPVDDEAESGFLARWSRLKREQAHPPETPIPTASAEADGKATAPAEPPPLTLADVEQLAADADFRPFLQGSVDPDVHRAALRKLWASDPIITTHDGLTDYADDYTIDPATAAVVRTAWKAGEGLLKVATEITESMELPVQTAAAPTGEADAADQIGEGRTAVTRPDADG